MFERDKSKWQPLFILYALQIYQFVPVSRMILNNRFILSLSASE